MPFFKKKNTESFINGSLDFKQLVDATHFLENHPDAVYTLNLDGHIVSFNQKLSLLLGYGGKQLHYFNTYDRAGEVDIDKFAQSSIVLDNIELSEEENCDSCTI